jgi:hypothetical protein
MALIQVHKIMISTALVFCVLFSARCFWLGQHALSAFFAAATVTLGAYFVWFLRTKTEPPGQRTIPPDSGEEG